VTVKYAELQDLAQLDLEPIIIKAMEPEEGLGWSFGRACRVADEYRKFLVLCMNDEHNSMVPSAAVDEFWHLHILDTQKYAQDCKRFLGFFLHHFPYFGMRGEEDDRSLQAAWLRTLECYESEFGERASPELWAKSTRCPRCGRRAPLANEARPSFRSMGLNA
jgi:hypothetical protein